LGFITFVLAEFLKLYSAKIQYFVFWKTNEAMEKTVGRIQEKKILENALVSTSGLAEGTTIEHLITLL
jgi:uncharacterized hydantoinase/oxoprolinase family protein